jgi:hypothetical protein
MKWVRHVACMEEMRNAYNFLAGKPEGKCSLERRRCRWEDNVKMDLRELGYEGLDWIRVAQEWG